MALNKQNLALVGNSTYGASGIGEGDGQLKGSPRLWSYITQDTSAVMNTAGYFNDVVGLLTIGDIILAVSVDATNTTGVSAVNQFVVLSKVNGVVDVSNGTTISVADTD